RGPDETAGLDRQRAAQERQAQILPRAAALAVKQRGGDAIGKQRRGEVIQHRAQYEMRLVRPAALEHRHAAEALQYLVEAALVAERARVAIAGQPGIDEARVDLPEPRIIDAEPGRPGRFSSHALASRARIAPILSSTRCAR